MEDFLTRVNQKGAYIALMEDLIGPIEPSDFVKDYQERLKDSLKFFNGFISNRTSENEFAAGIVPNTNRILEPTHLCYAGNLEKKFKIVFIGLNPFKETVFKNQEVNYFPINTTTWEQLKEYHCPKNVEEMKKKSVYRHITENAFNGRKYHPCAFRVMQALLNQEQNKTFDYWKDIKKLAKSNGNEVDDFFITECYKHSVLHAEMIPYKSGKYNAKDSHILIRDEKYKKFLEHLLLFIEDNTSNDAWIVFMGHQDKVKDILEMTKDLTHILPPQFDSFDSYCKVFSAEQPIPVPIYRFKYNGGQDINNQKNNRKVVIMPFINNPTHGWVYLSKNGLINELKSSLA